MANRKKQPQWSLEYNIEICYCSSYLSSSKAWFEEIHKKTPPFWQTAMFPFNNPWVKVLLYINNAQISQYTQIHFRRAFTCDASKNTFVNSCRYSWGLCCLPLRPSFNLIHFIILLIVDQITHTMVSDSVIISIEMHSLLFVISTETQEPTVIW